MLRYCDQRYDLEFDTIGAGAHLAMADLLGVAVSTYKPNPEDLKIVRNIVLKAICDIEGGETMLEMMEDAKMYSR